MTWKPLANAVGSELINVMFETKLDRLPSKHLWFHEFVAICSISLLVAWFYKQARIVRKKTYREYIAPASHVLFITVTRGIYWNWDIMRAKCSPLSLLHTWAHVCRLCANIRRLPVSGLGISRCARATTHLVFSAQLERINRYIIVFARNLAKRSEFGWLAC